MLVVSLKLSLGLANLHIMSQAADPTSLITASSDDKDLVVDVLRKHSICAAVLVQQSDVHNANASTIKYAHETSSVDDET